VHNYLVAQAAGGKILSPFGMMTLLAGLCVIHRQNKTLLKAKAYLPEF